jgi:hypothetical protein
LGYDKGLPYLKASLKYIGLMNTKPKKRKIFIQPLLTNSERRTRHVIYYTTMLNNEVYAIHILE